VRPSAIRMAEVIQVTAIAVPSAMRIRTAPPFVGRTWRQALLGGGRAPAIAYAPRSESGKASSDLAYRRRVCGRLCEARGLSSVCPLFVVSRLARGTGAPKPRLVLVCPTGITFCIQLNCTPQHAAERPIRLCAEQCSRMVSIARFAPSYRTVTWSYVDRDCDVVHKIRPEGAYLPLLIPLNGPLILEMKSH
jgi:hypothetical protein